MSRSTLVFATAFAILVAGCARESVRRAALAPPLQPAQRSGQPIGDSTAEISAGSGSLFTLVEPRERSGANAGLAIPRFQAGGDARFRLTKDVDIGLVWDVGLRHGAHSVRDDQPVPDHGDAIGAGIAYFYSHATQNPDFRIGVAADLRVYSVPWVEYRTCIENCAGKPFSRVRRSRSRVPVVGAALIPSYRMSDSVAVFGGATLRNHPTIPREAIEVGSSSRSRLRPGPINVIASAGAEYTSPWGPRVMVQLDQPVRSKPIRYGPSLGFNVTVPLGGDR